MFSLFTHQQNVHIALIQTGETGQHLVGFPSSLYYAVGKIQKMCKFKASQVQDDLAPSQTHLYSTTAIPIGLSNHKGTLFVQKLSKECLNPRIHPLNKGIVLDEVLNCTN